MIDPGHPRLSIVRQCELASISRSSFYREPTAETEATLRLMRLIDEQFLETPWYGSRQMARHLRRNGWCVGRHRVRRLMSKMGLAPIYQRPKTSEPHPQHRIWPYLLRHRTIDRPNQVWCADVTYIPMRRGFLYLVAIMDWFSRKVLAWRLSNTMDADFCVAALEEAIARFGRPEIFNFEIVARQNANAITTPKLIIVSATGSYARHTEHQRRPMPWPAADPSIGRSPEAAAYPEAPECACSWPCRRSASCRPVAGPAIRQCRARQSAAASC